MHIYAFFSLVLLLTPTQLKTCTISMFEASPLDTKGRSSLFTKQLVLHLPFSQLCSHLNLLKHQPFAFPLNTLLQSLCACSAASGFQAG